MKVTSMSNENLENKRREVINKFLGLTDKMIAHIEWSIIAIKPCVACDLDGKAKAKDVTGACAMCHGTKLVPDVVQRNWATIEIAERISPKPKSVEMTIDKSDDIKALESEVAKLKSEDIDTQLAALGVKV